MSRRSNLGVLLCAALAAAFPPPLSAQAVAGTVQGGDLAAGPLSGAFVALLDASGDQVDATFSSAGGEFRLVAPSSGSYRIRVQRIGYANWESEPYELATGQTKSVDIRIPLAPIALADLDVTVVRGTPIRPHLAQHHAVTPGLFEDLGIPVVRGREFTPDDGPGSEPVAIIDTRLELRFNGEDPVGKLIQIGAGDDPGTSYLGGDRSGGYWHRIVGVVLPPEPEGLASGSTPVPAVYLSALQHPPSAAQLLTRPGASSDDPVDVAAALATAGVSVVPSELRTLAERLATARRAVTGFGLLFALAGLAALFIAIRGLVDLVSLDIASRIPELGVRRAVGARRVHIRWLVRLDTVRLVAVGGALGTVGAVGLSVGLADRFAAVETPGLATVAAVVGVLALVALLASWAPARRAGTVTPIQAIASR